MSGENWALIALIAAVAEYKTVAACLRHRATQRAADRKQAKETPR